VSDLFRTSLAARRRHLVHSGLGAVRPTLGTTDSDDSAAPVAAHGGRRMATAGELGSSTHALAHEVATRVSDVLAEHDIAHFVAGREGDALAFGIALDRRLDALRAIGHVGSTGWYVAWNDGPRGGFVALADAHDDRHVRRARQWTVVRAHRFGERVVGFDQGARISFWEHGSSGQVEKIGTRGQDRYDCRSASTVEVIDGHRYPGNAAFPVGRRLDHVDLATTPIDVVYTWVDGADADWADGLRRTATDVGRSIDEGALDPARYRSRDELKYSLRSVWAYCGWVRRIWIVTAGQRPDWLVETDRIRIVDHSEILPDTALPTFNSHAIEAALHRIDGLAEHFIYFNDDMFVARPVRPEQFFTSNGLARVFPSDARPPGVEDDATIAVDTGALRGRELLDERFGRVALDKPHHSPYPQRRSVCLEMEEEFDVVGETQHSRFRSPTDLSTAASFAQHYAVATGRGVFGDISTEYVHVESGRLQWHLDRIRLGDDLDTFCVNETGERAVLDDREDRLARFFESVQPLAAPWERG